jgi:hypothetical protein
MTRGRQVAFAVSGAVVVSLFVVAFVILLGPDVVTTSCTENHSTTWGFFVMLFAFVGLGGWAISLYEAAG